MIIQYASPRRLLALACLCVGARAAAQPAPAPSAGGWKFTAPDAAGAWFATLDAARLGAPGALPFYRGTREPDRALRAALAEPPFEILHFVPLYYPSASREALVRAVRAAASGAAAPPAARASFLVGTLQATLPAPSQRAALARLADAVARTAPAAVPASALARWQREWDARFAAALAPYLAAERLDAGVVMIADALGAEGRLFAGRPGDRTDNLAAVGTLGLPDSADAPLFALVRELCFPLVARAQEADAPPRGARATAARRASLAAVRCGAELLDRLVPAEASRYREHWQRAAGAAGTFDALFPQDPVLAPRLHAAIGRLTRSP